jgi:hypothetical protein
MNKTVLRVRNEVSRTTVGRQTSSRTATSNSDDRRALTDNIDCNWLFWLAE